MGSKSKNNNHITNNDVDRESEAKKDKLITPHWFPTDPMKRWTEEFFLKAAVFWIAIFGLVVVTKAYMV